MAGALSGAVASRGALGCVGGRVGFGEGLRKASS